jgi:hypothetical protein
MSVSDTGWHCFPLHFGYSAGMGRARWISLLVFLWMVVPYPYGLLLFVLSAYLHGMLQTPKAVRYRNPLGELTRRRKVFSNV